MYCNFIYLFEKSVLLLNKPNKVNVSSECIFGEISGLVCEWADCVECGKTYGRADHWGTPRTEADTDSYWENIFRGQNKKEWEE